MQSDLRRDFNTRTRELVAFYRHIKVHAPQTHQTVAERALRAAVYLFVYNLVEATARSGVVAIVDKLKEERVSFNDTRAELRRLILRHLRKRAPENIEPLLTELEHDIFAQAFDPGILFSGNVDARSLRKMANHLGLDSDFRGPGDDLLIVKTKRNDLAHGNKTFSEVGREVSPEDLRRHVFSVIYYLRGFVGNVERFIVERQYLRESA
jgi:hypothetical protein